MVAVWLQSYRQTLMLDAVPATRVNEADLICMALAGMGSPESINAHALKPKI